MKKFNVEEMAKNSKNPAVRKIQEFKDFCKNVGYPIINSCNPMIYLIGAYGNPKEHIEDNGFKLTQCNKVKENHYRIMLDLS